MVDLSQSASPCEVCRRLLDTVGRTLVLPLSLLALLSSASGLAEYRTVTPDVETNAVPNSGDAADDPAIWIHPTNPERSLILGTNKQRGLEVYDLDGARVQSLDVGNLNNIDLRQRVEWDGQTLDIAVATNRSTNSLSLFAIDRESGIVKDLSEESIALELPTPYGVCLFKQNSSLYAFVNDKNGKFEQWELKPRGQSRRVRTFSVDSQPEGCVVDDVSETIYYGEEELGVWKRSARPDYESDASLLASISESALVADIEGMAIYRVGESNGYLVVSSQGDNSFALFDLEGDNNYVGSFRIMDVGDRGIDGVSSTDGIDISSVNLSRHFPIGILVVQDDENSNPPENQNFKIVDWRKVANEFSLSKTIQ